MNKDIDFWYRQTLREKPARILADWKADREKLEAQNKTLKELVLAIDEICLCERFKTYGFDYHEQHPKRNKNNGGNRPFTPRDLIENYCGREWKYDDTVKPYKSWQEVTFKKLEE